MKKVFVITLTLLLMVSTSFALTDPVTGTLTVGGSADAAGDATDTLAMGLSANVSAVYEDGGAVQTQWYAIATSHLGGKQVYGTAQDVTALYKLANDKVPGTPADFAGMPADATASSSWSSGVWKQL